MDSQLKTCCCGAINATYCTFSHVHPDCHLGLDETNITLIEQIQRIMPMVDTPELSEKAYRQACCDIIYIIKRRNDYVMKTELCPCPFCGKKPAIVQEGRKNEYDLVECRNPDCLMWPKTHPYTVTQLAINAWNTRYDYNADMCIQYNKRDK